MQNTLHRYFVPTCTFQPDEMNKVNQYKRLIFINKYNNYNKQCCILSIELKHNLVILMIGFILLQLKMFPSNRKLEKNDNL